MKEFIRLLVIGFVFLISGCVATSSSIVQKEKHQCPLERTTEEAIAEILNRTGPGTRAWDSFQDQAAMDRLKDAYNSVPPLSIYVEEVDDLIIFAAPNTESVIYILSLKGCAVAIGITNQSTIMYILKPQGVAL